MSPEKSVALLKMFANAYRSGAHGASLDCDAAQELAAAIDCVLGIQRPISEISCGRRGGSCQCSSVAECLLEGK